MATGRVLCSCCLASCERDEAEAISGDLLCPECARRRRASLAAPASAPSPFAPSDAGEETLGRSPASALAALVQGARDWCAGRLWWARLPLWLYFAYVLVRHWREPGEFRSLFDGINLGIHELGHVIFRPFGRFLTVAGGTIAQCLAPIASVPVFVRQRDYFGISVCVCWLATNLWGVAVYMGDARSLALPLVAPGVGMMPPGETAAMHDWRYMLGRMGLLQWDTTFAWLLRLAATGVMLAGLTFGAWLLVRMAIPSRREIPSAR